MEQWDTDDDQVLAMRRNGPRLLPPQKAGTARAIHDALEQERQRIAQVLRQRNVSDTLIREIFEQA